MIVYLKYKDLSIKSEIHFKTDTIKVDMFAILNDFEIKLQSVRFSVSDYKKVSIKPEFEADHVVKNVVTSLIKDYITTSEILKHNNTNIIGNILEYGNDSRR